MFIISPLSQCASPEKRDRFLSYIEKIAPVTFNTEPNCHGYAWFRSAADNGVVPSHWLRGFEIYGSVDANQIEHRASNEYQAFRKAVGDEGLLAKPSDLRFWHPTGIGFLTKEGQATFSKQSSSSSLQYLVTDEFVPRPGARRQVFEHLCNLATASQSDDAILTFWVQDRIGDSNDPSREHDDNSVYVLVRSQDKKASDVFYSQTGAAEWENIDQLSEDRRMTTWIDSGIGFIGR